MVCINLSLHASIFPSPFLKLYLDINDTMCKFTKRTNLFPPFPMSFLVAKFNSDGVNNQDAL